MTMSDLRALYSDLADEAPAAEPLLAAHLSRRTWRPGRVLLGGVAAAAVIAVGAVALPGSGHPGLGSAQADPILVLDQAATAARALPAIPVPRPDQYFYVAQDGSQDWLSIDGTHDSERKGPGKSPEVDAGCRNGTMPEPGNYVGLRPQPCTPDPAYVADAPTTTAGMVLYLQHKYGMAGANGIGSGAMDLMRNHLLQPAARAAVFGALARIPHLRVVPAKHGLFGITWNVAGVDDQPDPGATTILFDSATHEFRGWDTVGIDGVHAVYDGGPVVTAVVDRPGELP